ncbi:uncharacterized protein LOC122717574 [Apis laboriosa]|uniref:uncharacterized protein LOC122717574 n=1 Tax=Apis laboriosa TaxID=183418 RepID=UPI001CC56622|nr:uncharacterized protein LOC122717574 [Apis laboriosa]
MDFNGDKYYKIIRVSYSIFGLSSYKYTRLKIFHIAVIYLIFSIAIYLIFAPTYTNICTHHEILIYDSQQLIVTIISFLSYTLLLFQCVDFKDWLKKIEFNWNELWNKEEFRILKSNALIGKHITLIYLDKKIGTN